MTKKIKFYETLRNIDDQGKMAGLSDELIIAKIFETYLDNRSIYKESIREVWGYILMDCDLDDELIMPFFEKNNISLEDLNNA